MVGKLEAFANANFAPESRRPAESAIARIGHRAKVARDRLPEVDDWLRARPQ